MILNNGAADRQPHAHALRLGGVESVEDLFEILLVDPKLRGEHLRRLALAGIDVAAAEQSG